MMIGLILGLGLGGGLKAGDSTSDDERTRMTSPIQMGNHIHNVTSNNSLITAMMVLGEGSVVMTTMDPDLAD
ncbi:hypothetical protein BDN71DRAFT_1456984 [Pleurotus eryngii]|uniref:Uncharacterized protein n=1 Tax=Pleurotus eryngii TaxID=5323 RepID=A0A9P5ZKF0_PLEER|nr:hypothetical protein BDN71DRAFT_1456984 [Pleurotus eryngii]